MQRRRLGALEVSAVGLGCATMTPFYDEPDRDAAIDTLRRARDIGIDLLDSSDAYGQGRNEELIASAVKAIAASTSLPPNSATCARLTGHRPRMAGRTMSRRAANAA